MRSPELVSALASAATALALWRLDGVSRRRAGWLALALWAGALQPWLPASPRSPTPPPIALRRRRLRRAHLAGRRAALLGAAAMALALGTRVSYWPLALSFAVVVVRLRAGVRSPRRARRRRRRHARAGSCPSSPSSGRRALVALGRVHLAGHFADWGGSVATRPDVVARAAAFARNLAYDGLWPNRFALSAALAGCALLSAPPAGALRAAVAAIVVVPYALWALLAQNVLTQPRHLLPLVAAAIVAIAIAAARRPLVGAALAALAFAASAPLVVHRAPPAAAVVAERVAAQLPGRDDVIVFARAQRPRHAARRSRRCRPRRRARLATSSARSSGSPSCRLTSSTSPRSSPPTTRSHTRLRTRVCTFAAIRVLDRQSPCVTLRSYNWQP